MPLLYLLGIVGVGLLALQAGKAKTEAERGIDPIDPNGPPPPPVPKINGLSPGCYEVWENGACVGLATEEQAIRIEGARPQARFRRIG